MVKDVSEINLIEDIGKMVEELGDKDNFLVW